MVAETMRKGTTFELRFAAASGLVVSSVGALRKALRRAGWGRVTTWPVPGRGGTAYRVYLERRVPPAADFAALVETTLRGLWRGPAPAAFVEIAGAPAPRFGAHSP